LHDVVLDTVEIGDGNVVKVEDGARRLDWVSDGGRTGGQSLGDKLFVFPDETLELTFWSGDGIECFDI
jgi:hypothetical protein